MIKLSMFKRSCLVAAILLVTISVEVTGIDCFYANDVCPNGNISFWLRNRRTPGTQITETNVGVVPLIQGAPLIVSIHGWTGHKNFTPNPELISAYMTRGNYNIIIVDWGKLALNGCYVQSAYNAPIVGRCTARLLQLLYNKWGKHWKEATHVIGFSMGAHVAGALGYHLPKLPRITGLDPALPLFSAGTCRIENRLDPTDADFVDAYHSCGGTKGTMGNVGHVDFYLNNGATQPGCKDASCHHRRAVLMFSESINSGKGFYGKTCTLGIASYLSGLSKDVCPSIGKGNIQVRAGEYVSHKTRGKYRIETNSQPPLAKGLM